MISQEELEITIQRIVDKDEAARTKEEQAVFRMVEKKAKRFQDYEILEKVIEPDTRVYKRLKDGVIVFLTARELTLGVDFEDGTHWLREMDGWWVNVVWQTDGKYFVHLVRKRELKEKNGVVNNNKL